MSEALRFPEAARTALADTRLQSALKHLKEGFQVKRADAPVESAAEERLEFFLPHAGVVGLPVAAAHARAHADAGELQGSFSERDGCEGVVTPRGRCRAENGELRSNQHAAGDRE